MKRPRDPSAASGDGWDGTGYDIAADPQHAWGQEVLDRMTLRSGASVLDAGCGSGRVTEELLRRYPDARVVAIDASASIAEAAQVRLTRFGARVRVECARLPDGLP